MAFTVKCSKMIDVVALQGASIQWTEPVSSSIACAEAEDGGEC